MLKIHEITAENFRCFKNITFDLNPQLTVFVGKNCSGKSTILDICSYLLHYLAIEIQGGRYLYPKDIDITNGSNEINLNYILSDENANLQDINFTYSIDEFNRINRKANFNNLTDIKYATLCVYYSSKRIVCNYKRLSESKTSTQSAFENAFEHDIDFSSTMSWFIEKSIEETLKMRRAKNFNLHIPELDTVRYAVAKSLEEYDEPYIDGTPPRIFITHKNNPEVPLLFEQLSDGHRILLAMIMDLARRLIVANQNFKERTGLEILDAPAIVLIDEIELHLHPAWQQTVLPTLCKLFPNVQFIVTTNSPLVISSIKDEHIRIIDDNKIFNSPQGTWGAEAQRILTRIFGVDTRSPSEATDMLNKYADLVYGNKWDSEEALNLREKLNDIYLDSEPLLDRLDLYIDNKKWQAVCLKDDQYEKYYQK